MAQIKKHESQAAKQKAYRERKRNAVNDVNVTPKLIRVWTDGIGERLMTGEEIRVMWQEWFEQDQKRRGRNQ